MTLELPRLRPRKQDAWPMAPFLAFGLLVSIIQFRSGATMAAASAVLLIVASLVAGYAVMRLDSTVSRIAASSVVSAIAVMGYAWIYGLDVATSFGLFLAADAVLILSCIVYGWAAEKSARTSELAAMLLFEGEVASRDARDNRQATCRALLSLAQRNERAFSILRLEWPLSRLVEDERASTAEGEASRIHDHMVRYHVVSAIEQMVRASDVVLPARARNCVYVACPETEAAGARALARRIARALSPLVSGDLVCSSASYPADGYLIEELIAEADGYANRWSERVGDQIIAPVRRPVLSDQQRQTGCDTIGAPRARPAIATDKDVAAGDSR